MADKKYTAVHLLPLVYYVTTRERISTRELATILGTRTSLVRKLLWSARRKGLVTFTQFEDQVIVEPTQKARQIVTSIDYVARNRNKLVIIAGGAIIFVTIRPRKGIRAYTIPRQPLCKLLRLAETAEKEKRLLNLREAAHTLNLHPKTVSTLYRVLRTLGCPGTSCIVKELCREGEEIKE